MSRFLALFTLLSVPMSLWAYRGGAPLRSTGAPGDSTCNQCHGRALNAGGGALRISASARVYRPGVPITIRVQLSDPKALRWGFHLTARHGEENRYAAGSFQSADGDTSTQSLTQGETMTHTYDGVRDRQTGSAFWEVVWTPPQNGVDTVTFYAAGNAANGDGDNWGDDQIYTAQLRLARAGTVEARNHVAAGLETGEGWVRQARLLNATDQTAEAHLGEDLRVTLDPWQVSTVSLPAGESWLDAELADGTQLEVLQEHPELGRCAVAAGRISAAARVLALDPGQELRLLNPGLADGAYELASRDAGGALLVRETVHVAARQQARIEIPENAASVALTGDGAPFVAPTRTSSPCVAALRPSR